MPSVVILKSIMLGVVILNGGPPKSYLIVLGESCYVSLSALCPSVPPSSCPSAHLPICPSAHLLSVSLSNNLLFVCLPTNSFICLFIYPAIHLSVSVHAHPPIYVPSCMSFVCSSLFLPPTLCVLFLYLCRSHSHRKRQKCQY